LFKKLTEAEKVGNEMSQADVEIYLSVQNQDL